MNILLATSPHVRHAAVLQSDFVPNSSVMYSFSPLGLLSLAAVLRKELPIVDCSIYDLNRRVLSGVLPLNENFYSAVATDICSRAPDIIGFMTECDSFHHILQIAGEIKRVLPNCMVVLGGPHASAVANETLKICNSIDAVVIGEGEQTFLELIKSVTANRSDSVPGVLMRGHSGCVIDGGTRNLIECLDDIPIPAYELYNPDQGEELFIEVGRGCPYQCTFCSTAPFWRRRHRVKTAGRILQEIDHVKSLFDVKRVYFTHDLFTTNREWVLEVCEALIQADTGVKWTCSARTDTVDDYLLAKMTEAGCDAIYFGIESGSKRILKEIEKEIELSQTFHILSLCKRHGITPNVGFIVGFPGEDTESLHETFAVYEKSLRVGCRPAHIFAYCPFVESSMYAELDGLQCSGHFVDLPLGTKTDIQNRRIIANNQDLYGAYYRSDIENVIPGIDNVVYAMDEFSPLVEAVLVPTLALADIRGGMFEVFREWVIWIQKCNDDKANCSYRRGYGSAYSFSKFILEKLISLPNVQEYIIAVAQTIHMNHEIAKSFKIKVGTSMAPNLSLVIPEFNESRKLELNARVLKGTVISMLALNFDVSSALKGHANIHPTANSTYLVWQMMVDGNIRLLQISRFIFESLKDIEKQPRTVGELILKEFYGVDKLEELGESSFNPIEAHASIEMAVREGLIVVEV